MLPDHAFRADESLLVQHRNQPMYAEAVKKAVDDGCENINAVIIDGAQIFIPPMENAIANLGKSFGDIVILPPTAQDYSAEVAQATSGADCVISIISETPFITWNTAWTQSGTEAQQYGLQGNLNEICRRKRRGHRRQHHRRHVPGHLHRAVGEYRVALDEAGLDLERAGLQLARRDGGRPSPPSPDRRDDRR